MLKGLNCNPAIRRILGGGKMRLKTIIENLLTIPLSIKEFVREPPIKITGDKHFLLISFILLKNLKIFLLFAITQGYIN